MAWYQRAIRALTASFCGIDTQVERHICIVALDIDHFKRINDEHGHAAGDQVLKALANVLRQSVDSKNHIARTGGEEFCILLPETDLDAARQPAESIRSQCEQTHVATDAPAMITFTVSAGVSQMAPAEAID